MPVTGATLDHVAVAVERWADAWPRYVTNLGGRWSSGGANVGFAPAQLAYANGARLEVLQPWQSDANPFLRRFLDSSGPGPHHLTFKVQDIGVALAAVEDAGLTPVSVDLSDPGWKEAFLQPRQAWGTVVQLAQAAGSWQSPPPEGFPTAGPATPAELVRVTHAVADLDGALALFVGILGGTVVGDDRVSDNGWVAATVSWGGPLLLQLVAPQDTGTAGPLVHWLGGRPGRVRHLVFARTGAVAGPGLAVEQAAVPGVLPGESVTEVVEPNDNHGTRLVVIGSRLDTS